MNQIRPDYISTVPVHQMENEIIRINQKGFIVFKSKIIDGNIKLFASKRLKSAREIEL